MIDVLPGVIPGGLGCYACARVREETCPFCAVCWARVGDEHRAKLDALYEPGQHATGQCKTGWIAAVVAACAFLEALP